MANENGQKLSAGAKFMNWYTSYQGKRIVGIVYSLGASIVIIGALFKILHWPGAKQMLMVGMFTEAILFAIGTLDKPHADFHWYEVFPQLVNPHEADPVLAEELAHMARPNLAAVSGGAAPVAAASAGVAAPSMSEKDAEALKQGFGELAKTAQQLADLGKVATATGKLGEKLEAAGAAADKFAASQESVVAATANLGTAAANLGNAYANVNAQMQNVEAGTKTLAQNVENAGQKLSSLNAIYELQITSAQAQAEAYKAQAQKVNALGADVEKLQAAQAEALKNGEAYLAATKKLADQVADLNKVYGNMLTALA